MGLLKSVNDITYELQGQKAQKEAEKQEKKRQQLRRNRLKNALFDYFDIELFTSSNIPQTYFELLSEQNKILDFIVENYQREYETKVKESDKYYLKQSYMAILNNAKKIYIEKNKIITKQQKEAEKQRQEEEKRKEQEQEQQEARRQAQLQTAGKIIKGVVALPLIACGGFIYAALDCNYKSRRRRRRR